MAKRFGKNKIKLTEKQLAKINAKFSGVAVVASIANKKKKKKIQKDHPIAWEEIEEAKIKASF